MSKFADAATTIRKAAVKYEQMVALAAVLDDIGSLEQVAKEQKLAAEKATIEAEKAKAEMVAARERLASADASAAELMQKAMAAADEIVEDVRKAAQEEAAVIVKGAQDEASKLIAQASTEKARLSSEIGGLQKSVVDAKSELQSLERAKLDAIKHKEQAEEQLASLREKIKQLLG